LLSGRVGTANGGCIDGFDFGEEAIAAAWDGFDEARAVGGIAEGIADLVDGFVEAVVEVDIGVGGPETFLQIFAGDDLAGMVEEHREDADGLFLEADAKAVFAELAGAKIEFENSEAEPCARLGGVGHQT
jgi:hypothetical protein